MQEQSYICIGELKILMNDGYCSDVMRIICSTVIIQEAISGMKQLIIYILFHRVGCNKK